MSNTPHNIMCDNCGYRIAEVDSNTKIGSWGYLCCVCFKKLNPIGYAKFLAGIPSILGNFSKLVLH